MNKETSRRRKNTRPAWQSRPTRRLRWSWSAWKPWQPWRSESTQKATSKFHQKCNAEFDKMSDKNSDQNWKNNLTEFRRWISRHIEWGVLQRVPRKVRGECNRKSDKHSRKNETRSDEWHENLDKVAGAKSDDAYSALADLPELFEKFKSGLLWFDTSIWKWISRCAVIKTWLNINLRL